MNREEKLAMSLTAETTELLPFLPYLLQDFWELGSNPNVMTELIDKYVGLSENAMILDLGCGKGAVSVRIAQRLRFRIKGIDLIPEFIEFAAQKAKEFNVDNLCNFVVGDINEAVKMEKKYDCVILGAVGSVLGDPLETLNKLKATVKVGGYILIDEGYLPDESKRENVKYNNATYLTEQQWMDLFEKTGLELIETVSGDNSDNLNSNPDSDSGMAAITARANELIEKYPDKKAIFEGYIRSQQNEYDDIDNSLVCVTWVLRKVENDLLKNLNKIHTTKLGVVRIKTNLGLKNDDVVDWCKKKIQNADNIIKKGKNWYVFTDDVVITINAHSFTIITSHKRKEKQIYSGSP